jgi:hypothetical protein
VEVIHGQYTGAAVTRTRLTPEEVGVARVGHFGCFRAAMAGTLWERFVLPLLG